MKQEIDNQPQVTPVPVPPHRGPGRPRTRPIKKKLTKLEQSAINRANQLKRWEGVPRAVWRTIRIPDAVFAALDAERLALSLPWSQYIARLQAAAHLHP